MILNLYQKKKKKIATSFLLAHFKLACQCLSLGG